MFALVGLGILLHIQCGSIVRGYLLFLVGYQKPTSGKCCTFPDYMSVLSSVACGNFVATVLCDLFIHVFRIKKKLL